MLDNKVDNFTRQKIAITSQIPAWDGVEAQTQPLELMVGQWGNRQARPERTFLLVHGITANLHWWETLAEAMLAATDEPLWLIAPDLRGRGDSDKPAEPYSVMTEAADLAALLDALNIQQPINYIGHSLGAHIGVVFAASYPTRVRRLTLMDGGTPMAEDVGESIAPALRRLGQLYPTYEAFVTPLMAAGFIPDWNEKAESAYRYDVESVPGGIMSKVYPDGIAQEARHLAAFYHSVDDFYTRIQAPVLFVRAGRPVAAGLSPFVPLPALDQLSRQLKAGLQVIEVAESNHYTVQLFPTPEVVRAVLD